MFWKKKPDPADSPIFIKQIGCYSVYSDTGDLSGHAIINLYETPMSKKRTYDVFGLWSDSPAAIETRAMVEAWCKGGPIPSGMGSYSGKPKPDKPTKFDRKEALEILGLGSKASMEQILEAHKRLMKAVHPDAGGTDYLAKKVNLAKDLLTSS